VQNATPSDVARFGDRVITSALDHTSLEDLARCNGESLSIIDASENAPNASSSSQLLPIPPKNNVSRTPLPRQLPVQGSLTPPSASSLRPAYSACAKLEGSDPMLTRQSMNRNPYVDWARDVENKYVNPTLLGATNLPIDTLVIPYNINERYVLKEDLTIMPW